MGISLLVAGNGGIDVVKVRDALAIGVVFEAAVRSAHLAPKRGSKLGDIARLLCAVIVGMVGSFAATNRMMMHVRAKKSGEAPIAPTYFCHLARPSPPPFALHFTCLTNSSSVHFLIFYRNLSNNARRPGSCPGS